MTSTDKQFYKALGKRIAQFRKARNLTQQQLAEILGISQQTMDHYEGGRLRVAVVKLPSLTKAIGVTVEDILQEEASATKIKRGPASKLQQQVEQIGQLPRAKQRLVSEMMDTVLQQAG